MKCLLNLIDFSYLVTWLFISLWLVEVTWSYAFLYFSVWLKLSGHVITYPSLISWSYPVTSWHITLWLVEVTWSLACLSLSIQSFIRFANFSKNRLSVSAILKKIKKFFRFNFETWKYFRIPESSFYFYSEI